MSWSQRLAGPAALAVTPDIRSMPGADSRLKNAFVQRLEQFAVGDEEDRAVGVATKPFADDTNHPRSRLMPRLGIGRHVLTQALMRLKTNAACDLVDDQTFETTEMPLSQITINEHWFLKALRNDGGSLERANQRACDDDVHITRFQRQRRTLCLRNTKVIEGNIGVALKPALHVPVGLAVAKKIEASLRDRQICALSSGCEWAGLISGPNSMV